MTEREALKLALEALHGFIPYLPLNDEAQCGRYDKAITAIKEALAQPEQHQDWCASLTQMLMSMPPKPAPCNCKPEPLPWIDKMVIDVPNQPLYTAPQRKPLTDEEIRLQWSEFWETECHPWAIEFARAIEAAHGIKGEV